MTERVALARLVGADVSDASEAQLFPNGRHDLLCPET